MDGEHTGQERNTKDTPDREKGWKVRYKAERKTGTNPRTSQRLWLINVSKKHQLKQNQSQLSLGLIN